MLFSQFVKNLPRGGVFGMIFCPRGRGFALCLCPGMGNSPVQKIPLCLALGGGGMVRLGIDSYFRAFRKSHTFPPRHLVYRYLDKREHTRFSTVKFESAALTTEEWSRARRISCHNYTLANNPAWYTNMELVWW